MLLNVATDLIETANAPCKMLFGTDGFEGHRFSRFIDGSMQEMMLFLQEAEHRSAAWARNVALTTAKQTPLRCEIRGQFAKDDTDRVLLTFIDLDEMDARARATEAANLHRHGLMEWQRAQAFFERGFN